MGKKISTREKLLNVANAIKQVIAFNFLVSKEQKELRKGVKTLNDFKTNKKNRNILLIPLIDDFATMKMGLHLTQQISSEEESIVKFFIVHAPVDKIPAPGTSLSSFLDKLNSWSDLSFRRLKKAYGVKESDIVMSNFFSVNKHDGSQNFHSKEDVLNLAYQNIQIGELLYDTYLRFRAKPTIDLNDIYLYKLRDYMLEQCERWDQFFASSKVNKILLPYTSYHHWGIPAKLALKHNIEVITYGSLLYVFQTVTKQYQYHTKNFHAYPELFAEIDSQEKCLNQAREILSSRLEGKIDSGTSYMKKSAFEKTSNASFNFTQNRDWAVVYLHCFFDSPHIYGSGLFVDFYEWLNHILDRASQNPNIVYYLKKHPNGLPENEEIIHYFIDKYSEFENIVFLDPMVSNAQIMEARPKTIFTYYGTVAHEFAFKGIPAVSCGENPHSKYGFIYHAKSVTELDGFIDNVGKTGLPEHYNEKDIAEFFYMHYLYFTSELSRIDNEIVKNFSTGEIKVPNKPLQQLLFNTTPSGVNKYV